MNSSEWLPVPHIERELRQEKVAPQRLNLGCLAAVLGVFVLPVIIFWNAAAGLILLLVSIYAGMLLWATRSMRISELRERRQTALADEFSNVDGWIVQITVWQGHCPLGTDQGIAWLENERFYFSGYRTSFGLSTNDVAGNIQAQPPLIGLRSTVHIGLKTPSASQRAFTLGIDPVPSATSNLPAPTQLKDFLVKTQTWLHRANVAAPQSPGQLPPLTLGPDAPSTRLLLVRAVVSTAYWIAVAGVSLDGLLNENPTELLLLIPLGLIICRPEVLYPRMRWQAWNTRRQLTP